MALLTEKSTRSLKVGRYSSLVVVFFTLCISCDIISRRNFAGCTTTTGNSDTTSGNFNINQEFDVAKTKPNVLTMSALTQTNLTQTRMQFSRFPDPVNAGSTSLFTVEPRVSNKFDYEKFVKNLMQIKYTSPSSGHVITWGYEGFPRGAEQLLRMAANYNYLKTTNVTLKVPRNHVIMISFTHRELYNNDRFMVCHKPYVTLLNERGQLIKDRGHRTVNKCSSRFLSTAVYSHSLIVVYTYTLYFPDKFKMLFTLHPASQSPSKAESGLWNCSVPHYATFKQHVQCNVHVECDGGEDEGGYCPFSTGACDGGAAVNNKCYKLGPAFQRGLTWNETREKCLSRQGDLPVMKTEEEWQAFFDLITYGNILESVWVGLYITDMQYSLYDYGKVWMWIDNTTIYNFAVPTSFARDPFCLYISRRRRLGFQPCTKSYPDQVLEIRANICEHKLTAKPSVPPSKITFVQMNVTDRLFTNSALSMVRCPGGHVTFQFLKCDVHSHCGAAVMSTRCELSVFVSESRQKSLEGEQLTYRGASSVAMFVCDSKKESIPYSLVCDFKTDCGDRSDESFCVRKPECPEDFQCRNKQCVDKSKKCDFHLDCLDGTDNMIPWCQEYDARQWGPGVSAVKPVPPPAIVYHVKDRVKRVIPMNTSTPCPATHFRCPPANSGYCVPVYTRCNTVKDCPLGEDEVDCDNVECPGYYRCRASPVCVQVQNLCDGVPQCPQRDDEVFCHIPNCPKECRCQGLAFVCDRPFIANISNIRYLDASYSNMTLENLRHNVMDKFGLVYLKLSSCGLKMETTIYYPNLQYLDLSDNAVQQIEIERFLHLQNLRVLLLSGNPIVSMVAGHPDSTHPVLVRVDLSRTQLKTLDTSVFRNVARMQHLNLSFSSISTIADTGFFYTPLLRELDLRGNPIVRFPIPLYKGLEYLKTVLSDSYKLCCKINSPDHMVDNNYLYFCFAQEDELSSCEDLLRSDILRLSLIFICIMSVSGNAVSFVFRFFVQNRSLNSGFSVFVANLCVADFLMGVYLAIVGTADTLSRGEYVSFDGTWKQSVPCKIAGFLSLLSSEVSAFTISLITLDRFIVLRYPFTSVRFERWSAAVACGVAWVAGITLAVVPLLPVTVHWEFYSQSGICIPLPVTRRSFEGRDYSFGVMIVFNFTLFLFIAAGQVAIFRSVKATVLATDKNQKSKDIAIARRLISVAVSDFLCWFPIGLLGLLASADVPIPGQVNVVMAIFVLPINSALNPFLYTLNLILERRREKLVKKLLMSIESNVANEREVLRSRKLTPEVSA